MSFHLTIIVMMSTHKSMYIYTILIVNCLYGSVVKASDTQAVGHGFEPRPDHN